MPSNRIGRSSTTLGVLILSFFSHESIKFLSFFTELLRILLDVTHFCQRNFYQADILALTSSLTTLLHEGVEKRIIGTYRYRATAVPAKAKGRSYAVMAYWREASVLTPYWYKEWESNKK